MGEARNRLNRRAAGLPCRPPLACPRCRSRRVSVSPFPPVGLSHVETNYGVCGDCGTAWEAYPANWVEDVVGAEPCDNCAFRPGSPEQMKPDEWKALVEKLRAGGEFLCHKGIPLAIDPEAAEPVRFDFDAVPQDRRRWCSGFARLVWAMRVKGESWFEQRYRPAGEGSASTLPSAERMV